MRITLIAVVLLVAMQRSASGLSVPDAFAEYDWVSAVIVHFFESGVLDGFKGSIQVEDGQIVGDLTLPHLEELTSYLHY